MAKKSKASVELANPPSGKVRWSAQVLKEHSNERNSHNLVLVEAQTWFEARQLAAVALGAAPKHLAVALGDRP